MIQHLLHGRRTSFESYLKVLSCRRLCLHKREVSLVQTPTTVIVNEQNKTDITAFEFNNWQKTVSSAIILMGLTLLNLLD
jgi:hypothetical protein